MNSCEVWVIIKDENKMTFGYQNKHEWIKCVNIHKDNLLTNMKRNDSKVDLPWWNNYIIVKNAIVINITWKHGIYNYIFNYHVYYQYELVKITCNHIHGHNCKGHSMCHHVVHHYHNWHEPCHSNYNNVHWNYKHHEHLQQYNWLSLGHQIEKLTL